MLWAKGNEASANSCALGWVAGERDRARRNRIIFHGQTSNCILQAFHLLHVPRAWYHSSQMVVSVKDIHENYTRNDENGENPTWYQYYFKAHGSPTWPFAAAGSMPAFVPIQRDRAIVSDA